MDSVHFQKLYDDFRLGRIDRRRFLKASGLGLAAAVIAACTPGSSAKPTGAAGGGEPTAADWSPPSGVDLGKTLGENSEARADIVQANVHGLQLNQMTDVWMHG